MVVGGGGGGGGVVLLVSQVVHKLPVHCHNAEALSLFDNGVLTM